MQEVALEVSLERLPVGDKHLYPRILKLWNSVVRHFEVLKKTCVLIVVVCGLDFLLFNIEMYVYYFSLLGAPIWLA